MSWPILFRSNPLGRDESFTYDGNGNVLTHTDFNGKTTAYTDDAANRLLTKVPDASLSEATVTYTYSATGLRSKMTDASGTTSYSYAGGNYLSQEFAPEGQLGYTYDKAGNMTGMQVTGFADDNLTYTYDVLNRLSTVADSALPSGANTTSYAYDAAGNLKSATYPNGVVHSYAYDQKNRLTTLGVNNSSGPIESYAYTLDNGGHRTAVTELSGRTVNYSYDNIYRLASETIASDPASNNGTVGYTYDAVGNRTQMSSTLGAVPPGAFSYDADDRLALDTYDADGNTISSGGITNTYDFENRLIQQGGATIVYDGDGNRVQKTVGSVTTQYLVSTVNPTGYAQVVEESFSGGSGSSAESTRVFGYGLDRVDQVRRTVGGQSQTSFYVYDGHGSVRALTDPSGNITDTYDYDAFGNLIHSTFTGIPAGSTSVAPTPNEFLFAGEQFDSNLNLYYNRARYLNTTTGRFWTMDMFEGDPESPLSLHKYFYTEDDPVDHLDPSGNQDFVDEAAADSIANTLNGIDTQIGFQFMNTVEENLGEFVDIEGGGRAYQEYTPEALDARTAVEEGAPLLFRGGKLGQSKAAEGQYWALEHPLTTPNFAGKYGIPPENEPFDFVEMGRKIPGARFITRTAKGGTEIEVVVEPGAVELEGFASLDEVLDELQLFLPFLE